MGYGLGTWDSNGIDNNTGLVRILAVGTWTVSEQQTGSINFIIPSGYVMDYLFQSSQISFSTNRRRVTINGGLVTLSAVGGGDFSSGTEAANAGYYLFFLRAQ
ncbi:hypothetical protein LZU96_14905 [Pantoea agglomerans]|uniref:hypothetical protein n=1 Tax=Enterobacter agglomerans TaxID=549 RepID=UPI001F2409FF|nr:hypothetical protein [Pantoea agglomerans]UIL51508.1 hypothetical protein LZU96_14905 [Pantoea agglomerans]